LSPVKEGPQSNSCQRYEKAFRRQTERAAQLMTELAAPAEARVRVVGDTAFDAQPVQEACQARGFHWVVPVKPERVLEGPKPRPKVTSLTAGLSAARFAPVRLVPGQGGFVAQRRAARCWLGPRAKARTFYVPQERRAVHSVGEVVLAFSTRQAPEAGKPVAVPKVLMSSDRQRGAAGAVEIYDLRWQIELFFKELKRTLGLAHYRLRRFASVERWVELCLASFVCLEWYRARQLRRPGLPAKEKEWWQAQRSYGLSQAVRQELEDEDVEKLCRWTRTRGGGAHAQAPTARGLSARIPQAPRS
jgi:hypothetical protein